MNYLRRKVCLNGEWNFSPEAEARGAGAAVQDCHWEAQKLRVPSSWRWSEPLLDHGQPYRMFDYPEKWNAALAGVVGRTFTVQRQGSERVFLILNGVLQSSAVFVNGINVAESQEAWLPLEIDITDQVRDNAENDLKVWCGSFAGTQTESSPTSVTPWPESMATSATVAAEMGLAVMACCEAMTEMESGRSGRTPASRDTSAMIGRIA